MLSHINPTRHTRDEMAQFGSGEETAAQLATHFGSGEETAAQLAGRSLGAVKGRHASKGRSKPSGAPGQPKGERKKWPPGTVMGWCPNCGAEGKKGNKHDRPMQQGVRGGSCGRFSLSAPPG